MFIFCMCFATIIIIIVIIIIIILFFRSNTGTETTDFIVGGAVHGLLKYLYDTQASCLTYY